MTRYLIRCAYNSSAFAGKVFYRDVYGRMIQSGEKVDQANTYLTYEDAAARCAQLTAVNKKIDYTPYPVPVADEFSTPPDAGTDDAEALVFPLCRDVPGQDGWKQVRCPRCGKTCWLRPESKQLLREQPELVWSCSECAERSWA